MALQKSPDSHALPSSCWSITELTQTSPCPVPTGNRCTEPVAAREAAQQQGGCQDLHNCWEIAFPGV